MVIGEREGGGRLGRGYDRLVVWPRLRDAKAEGSEGIVRYALVTGRGLVNMYVTNEDEGFFL